MSKIEKLSIQGVRSFKPSERQNMSFFTPVTLIVGYNGSGKTTIIECLKYATTGELPPNSKGGAFIHDPKLCGEREVLAQVKLKFKTPPDVTHVVTRSLQLTVQRTKRSMKTLDSTLMTNLNGDKSSTSNKEADLSSLVPTTLGVAPAILDSVIFCHQDESLWPMSEPSALKKRFDEIFEAMKYTKAIENLKVLRKKHGEKLAHLKIREGEDKRNKEAADKCERQSIKLQDEIEVLRVKCNEAAAELADCEQKARELHEEANDFLHILNTLDLKKKELRIRQGTLEESKVRMDELTEPDQWLEDTLARYEEQLARSREDLGESRSQYAQHKQELEQSRRDLSQKHAEQGRHQADKETYERQVKTRIEVVHRTAQLHSIRGFDGDLDDQKVQAFYNRIDKILADKKRELERLQAENASEVDSKTATITELEGQRSQHVQGRVFAKQRIGVCEKRIAALQRDLNRVEVDEGAKALLDSELSDLQRRHQQANEDLRQADLDRQLQEENDRLQQLKNENSRLGRELAESTRLLSDRAQLEFRKKEVAEKRRKLTTLSNTWNDKLSAILDSPWEASTLDREYSRVLQQKTQSFDEASRKRDDMNQQLKTAQVTLRSAREKGTRRDAEIARCKKAVLEALKAANADSNRTVEDLPEEIERVEDNILTLEKDIFMFEHLAQYYQKCQKTLNKKNRCELCDRPFSENAEKAKLAAKIKASLEKTTKKEQEDELKMWEEMVGQLRAVRPQCETYSRLLSEKKESDRELKASQETEERLTRQLEELDELVREKREERQDVESMGKTVTNISQTYREIAESEAQLDRIESQQQSSGVIRSTEEISEAQEQCAEQLSATENKIYKLSSDRQRMRDLVTSLDLDISKLENKRSDAVRQLEKKKDYQDQIQSQKAEVAGQREKIQQADKDLEFVEPEIAKARAIRDDTLERGRAKEKNVADERDILATSVKELKMVDSDIKDYLDRGGPANLQNNERAIRALEKVMERTDKDMTRLTARIDKINEDVANSDGKKRNIIENLTYRKALRDIESIQRDIEELEGRNANEDYERLEREAKTFENRRMVLLAEKGGWVGEMGSKDDELTRLMAEYETQYQNAARTYRETHIKVETTKAAIEDLGRYGLALNNAIMKYHAIKMEEVNRIAGELWQNTYQGTDIDTILIKSDSEATGGRSSYNYRVCMMKQDTEMDMRGRCSAGQKVLASIIIRLALAESFGTGCGLIALDEPTTNLDRDNIRSLAESLHEIIRARKGQANFQLIVITHDEEFLRHMRCSDFCDDFWRVSRDSNQNSLITKESIATITG
ncbi:AAA domain-containing protein [Xylariomycetidae sp. FL0641]|nr:AAA domain-containing protein [Xylariomycetidae sp. FL0641]